MGNTKRVMLTLLKTEERNEDTQKELIVIQS